MFTKVLIANRGEIAVRIMQTCREIGIETVAVYSRADRAALHVRLADSAVYIGPAPARESYLDGSAIIRAALESEVDAIHPGYGFLSESAAFSAAVPAAGLTWVGPPSATIALLGDKAAAKRAAEDAGLRVVPGYSGTDASNERMALEAERIGYPIMLKAVAGGGGKGMRVVDGPSGLVPGMDAARREAAAAFGDDRIFIEKLLVRPRHVEMQILADSEGDIVYLGERDCSLQRRHQKVVEEAPSPIMTHALRVAMGEAAVRVARASGYINAGTVEFLMDGDDFYFLEVNTRIQVEHPVTEETTGLDLVRLQLEIAAGNALPFSQADVVLRGHAIEARIYAEDPQQHFLPSTGVLEAFEAPEGPGIRNDVSVQPGDAIATHYDPMIAKLIVHAETRALATARLQYALDRYVCTGPKTNLRFLRWVTREPAFLTGELDVGYIDREWHGLAEHDVPIVVLVAATLADAFIPEITNDPWKAKSGWRVEGMAHWMRYECGEQQYEVQWTAIGDRLCRIVVRDEEVEALLLAVRPNRIAFQVGTTSVSVTVSREANGYSVLHEGQAYEVRRVEGSSSRRAGGIGPAADTNLTAPMPGTVVGIAVVEGQAVYAGEPLIIMEAMKMEHIVEATSSGTVTAILVHQGDMVAAGTLLVQMDG